MKVDSGASVGVRLGVIVWVGVLLGLGETVQVGDCVRVEVWLAARVVLGVTVMVGLDSAVAPMLQPTSKPAPSKLHNNAIIGFLRRNAEKRVMIIDLPVVDAKCIFSVAYIPLRGCRCPGEVPCASRSRIASQ
jgi:hypothetical protein